MTDCILWPGKVDKDGYGRTTRGPRGANKVWRAHRLAYAEAHGLSFEDTQSVPPLMHSCDTPACINPAHLSPGTQADNMADMVSKGRACRGSDVCGSKLQERDVLGIRRQYVKGCRTYGARALARVYGVTKRTIEQVASGATWAHFDRFREAK